MDIADIIVTKGKLKDIQACESVIYAEGDEEIGGIDLDGGKKLSVHLCVKMPSNLQEK